MTEDEVLDLVVGVIFKQHAIHGGAADLTQMPPDFLIKAVQRFAPEAYRQTREIAALVIAALEKAKGTSYAA